MTLHLRRWIIRLVVDGAEAEGLNICRFAVDRSRYERCDTAEIIIAQRDRQQLYDMIGGRSGFERPDIMLQLRDENGDREWTTVFHGVLDAVTRRSDPSLYGLECRDYLAFLLDTRIASSWTNQTALDIVRQAAEMAGLTFDTSVSGISEGNYCGQFWQIEHRRLAATSQNRFQTAFDLAFSVARDHGLECYAQGKTIFLHQPGKASQADVFVPDAVTIQASRHDLGLASGVVVGVCSWDSRQRASSTIFYDGQNFLTEAPATGVALYTFRVPGQRMDDIRRLAMGKYRRIVSHAYEVRLVVPAIPGLMPRHFMSLNADMIDRPGTFSVDSVRHRFDLARGYAQDVVLRDRVY